MPIAVSVYMIANTARSDAYRKRCHSSAAAASTPRNGITTATMFALRSRRVTYQALPRGGGRGYGGGRLVHRVLVLAAPRGLGRARAPAPDRGAHKICHNEPQILHKPYPRSKHTGPRP